MSLFLISLKETREEYLENIECQIVKYGQIIFFISTWSFQNMVRKWSHLLRGSGKEIVEKIQGDKQNITNNWENTMVSS